MKRYAQLVAVLLSVLACPCTALAQENASIAGVVKDSSGAVLPGVTVEAASPALIEKTRSVVTDATGQYKIVSLRSGIYSVTFTLPGFSTVKREGVELTGSFVATINADMRVGALEETITVTGETPVVDVQTAKTQAVLNNDVLTAIPTARNYQNLHVLVPGVTVASGNQDVGGAAGDQQVSFSAHGGDFHDSHVLVNGLSVGAPQTGGGRTMYVPNAGTSQEVAITTSGGLGEAETAGVTVNMVYKDGGNAFKGSVFATGATQGMVSNNYDDALKAAGLRAPNSVKNVYDYEGTFGGPIIKSKLWFFGQARYHGNANYIAGMFYNKNAGNITKWTYDPDLSRQAVSDSLWTDESLRLTWQITPRNKFAVYYEDALRCTTCNGGGSATASPETTGQGGTHPNGIEQATWTSPVSNRILLEAGVGILPERYGSAPRDDFNPALIAVSAQNGSIPGLSYRAPGSLSKPWLANYSTRASITYTTGSNSMKFGYTGEFFNFEQTSDREGSPYSYRFTTPDPGGVPNRLTEFAWPFWYWEKVNNWGLYAQDQWTMKRVTIAGGIRYDRFTASFPDAQIHATLVPVPLKVAGRETTILNDITPRFSVGYDVFGDGKTAIKVNFGKYVLSQSSNGLPLGGQAAPMAGIPSSFNRSWTDSNGNFFPDCNLLSLAAQNLTATGGDICGASDNLNFGTLVSSSAAQDPALFYGWGNRPFNYAFDLIVQRELLPRVSVNVAYFRRWFGNFVVTQNRAIASSNYTVFNLPIPNDSRLPTSGSVQVQDLNPTGCGRPTGCFGVVDNYVTKAENFGNEYQHWNGLDLSVNARLNAVLLQGGLSTGRQSADNCEIVAKVPNAIFTGSLTSVTASTAANAPTQYCHVVEPFQTQVKILGSYTVPKIDVQAAATLQNIPGQEIQATYNMPTAVALPLIGRNLAGSAANASVNLLAPSTYYSDRVNQVDLRFAKLFRYAGKRAQVAFDMYNALNANTVQTYNSAYSPTGAWRVPTLILPARVMKVSAQLDF